jgi:hypothetical protein
MKLRDCLLDADEVQASYWPSVADVLTPKLYNHVGNHRYVEPCAGNGALIRLLSSWRAKCTYACDVNPREDWIESRDALTLDRSDLGNAQLVVTNPPFNSGFVYNFLDRYIPFGLPVWLLLPVDFGCRQTSGFVMPYCERMVVIGQIGWFIGSSKGYRQFAWYKFTDVKYNQCVFEWLDPTQGSSRVPDRFKA